MRSYLYILQLLLSVSCAFLVSTTQAQTQKAVPSIVVHKGATPTQKDNNTIDTGEVYLAIHFKIEPEWHIYWKYPGDAGLPTKVAFSGPKGIEFGELLWPESEKFMQSGDVVGYGYSGETALFSKVVVPEYVKDGEISAGVRWLECSKTLCVPGKAELKIPLKELTAPSSQYARDLSALLNTVPSKEESDRLLKERTKTK